MKNEIEKIEKKNLSAVEPKIISRKEAIKKAGFIAVSAATTMILLGTPKAAMASPAPCPDPKPKPSGGHGPWKK